MSETKITEILQAIEINDGVYQREAVDAALKLKEVITPHLIDILQQVLANPAKYILQPDYIAHIYAVILLGHFRESQTHQLIVDLFSLPEKYVDPLFGDLITEDLPIVLFRTCNASLEPMKALALNKEAYDFCRSAAMRGMTYAVADGLVPREEVLDFLGSLFTGEEAESGSDFWSFAANAVCDLYPEELMDVIDQAFESELLNPWFIDHEAFEKALAEGREQALEHIRADMRRGSLDDVHEHMSWWAMFDAEPQAPAPAPSLAPSPKAVQGQQKAKKKKKRKMAKASRKKSRRRK